MTAGEIIAALIKYASDWDGNYLLMQCSIYNIDVNGEEITIHYVDGNTTDVVIDKDGKFVRNA